MSELGAGDQLKEINSLVASTLEAKVDFEGKVRGEVAARDLSEEKIKNALGLKVKIPRFTGYDLPEDIASPA